MSNNTNKQNRKRNSVMATAFFALALLQFLLILLKATGKISSSWYVVLIPAELVLLIAAVSLLVIIGCLIYALARKLKAKGTKNTEKSADSKASKES